MFDKNSKILLILILILAMVLTGCWDYIDIEKRGYVSVIGIDKFEKEPMKEIDVGAKDPKDTPENRFSLTYLMTNVDYIVDKADEPNIIYTAPGETFYGSSRVLPTYYDKQVNFGHLKVAIIDEKVASDEKLFREVLDGFERDPFINRRLYMLLTSETAEKVINVEPVSNMVTANFLLDLLENKTRPARSGNGTISNIYRDVYWNKNTIIPRVIPGEEDIKVAGSGVIKNLKFEGWLGETDTRSLEIIRGEAKPEGINLKYNSIENKVAQEGDTWDYIISIALIYQPSKIKLIEKKKDNIKISVEIEVVGTIEEFYFQPKQDLLNPKTIDYFSESVCKKLTKELEDVTKKLQKEYKVDVMGIDRRLSTFHPKFWDEVKGDWEEIFPNIDIVINVNTNITQIGVLK